MKKPLFFLIIGIFILFLLSVQFTEAANGDVVITYDDELTGGVITGATVTINCNGSDATCTDGDAACDNDGSARSITLYSASSTLSTASCETDEETITKLEVVKDGYVTTTNIDDSAYNTGAQNDETAALDFGYKITLQDEKTTPATITSATLTAGASDTSCTYNTNFYYCPVPLADDDADADVDASKAGYVTKNWDNVLGGGRDSGADAQGTYTAEDMQFSQTIVITTEAVGAALTGATVTAGSGPTSCNEDDTTLGTYWCAVPYDEDDGSNDVSITLDGYVKHVAGDTGNRANDAAGQETVTVNDVQYGYKITSITTQVLGTNITASVTLTVGDATAENTCTLSGGAWYCPVALANSDGTLTSTPTLDGYVEKNYDLITGTTRTANTNSQRSDTVTGVEYAVKITALSGATVTTGDSYGTACTEGSNYYCAVPLADTETNVTIVKTGYDTRIELNAWTDRTSDTDAQATYTISIVAETISRPPGRRRIIKKEPIIDKSDITIGGIKTKIAEILAKIVQLKTQLQQLSGGEILEVPLEIPADYRFTVNLEYGQYSADVKYLQIFLNTDPTTQVSQSGAGSPGNETMYFGSLTKAAVIKFQQKYANDILTPWDLTSGTGYVGSTTRAKINEILGG